MQEKEPYDLINVPGVDDFRLLVSNYNLENYRTEHAGSKTPWWMVSMKAGKELLCSTVKGNDKAKDYAELYGFQIEIRRESSRDLGNQLFTSAMIKHEDCIISIPNAGYAAELENYMYMGKPIKTITMMCLGWFAGKLEPYQKLVFSDSYLVGVTHDLDKLFVKFRIQNKTHIFTVYDRYTAVKGGQSTCSINFSTNKLNST
jgi:hypothetical protein